MGYFRGVLCLQLRRDSGDTDFHIRLKINENNTHSYLVVLFAFHYVQKVSRAPYNTLVDHKSITTNLVYNSEAQYAPHGAAVENPKAQRWCVSSSALPWPR